MRNQTALITDRHGRQQLSILRLAPTRQRLLVQDFQWREDSRVDVVAARFYASETAWWSFAEANRHVMDWTDPAAGTRVLVPRALA